MQTPKQPKRIECTGSFFLEFVRTNMAIAADEMPDVRKMKPDDPVPFTPTTEGLAVVFKLLSTNKLDFVAGQEVFILFPTKVTHKSTSHAERIIESHKKLYEWFVDQIAQGTAGEYDKYHIDGIFTDWEQDGSGGKALAGRLRLHLITDLMVGPPKLLTLNVNAVGWRPRPKPFVPGAYDVDPSCN